METNLLIQENNEKRKLLNEENKKVYENMLIYIRLNYDKSEKETEEILMELLDHLLEAQEQGKTASDVFGDDPKAYANDIIGELPKAITKKRVMYVAMGILYFLSIVAAFNGIMNNILYYVFNMVELDPLKTYYMGTVAVQTLLSLCIVFVVIYFFLKYMRWATFKTIKKRYEYLLVGLLFGSFPFILFLGLFYIIPDFGPTITFQSYWLIPLGAVLYVLARYMKNKI